MSKILTYVEIDVDHCSRTYGVAPCTASIPATGAIKCFNSLGTCQDRANFNNSPLTLRFAVNCDYLPKNIRAIPSIESVSLSPGTISLGQNFGTRSRLTITFGDQPHSDAGTAYDKYPETRNYDPFERGTYWGKFRARNPYLLGRKVRLIRGVLGQALEEMEVRHFIIESTDGPGPDNTFTILARDVLKLASGDRAQAPRLSNGRLAADITNVATSATLAPSGIGNAEYPAAGFVCIGGREICAFTRVGNTLTLTRAQRGSTAAAHSEDDRVQLCLDYVSADPADIVRDLLVNYADVPSGFIPLAAWKTETGAFLQQLYTATIAEPTSVEQLIAEIIEQAALVLWWDDIAQLIRLQVLRKILPNALLFDGRNILEGTLSIKDQPELRISQVWTYFALRDPTKSVEDEDNYRSSVVSLALDASANYGVPAIKKIFSRWIPYGGRAIAIKLGDLQLARFQDPPRRISFELFREHETIEVGTGYRLADPSIQDATGAPKLLEFQVTRLNPQEDRFTVDGEEVLFNLSDTGGLNNRQIFLDSNAQNVNIRTIHDSFYPAPTIGDVGTVTVTVVVGSDAIISASSNAAPAFDVGSWPTGLEIIIDVQGTLVGADGPGGKGGNGGSPGNNGGAGVVGQPGGVAFYTRKAVKMKRSTAKIYGGRGGGGGGGGGGGAESVNQGGQTSNMSGAGGGGGGSYSTGGARGTGGNNGVAGSSTTGIGGAGGGPVGAGGIAVGGRGGAGGNAGSDYGQAGTSGVAGVGGTANIDVGSGGTFGTGGAGGAAIDGESFVTVLEGPGDVRGSKIN